MRCHREDEVVAHFLDGDLGASEADELAEHLGRCPSCRSALARSRHLDALVATSAAAAGDGAAAERVLQRALAATRAAPRPARPGRRRTLAAAAAGFVLGLAAMYAAHGSARCPPPAPPPVVTATPPPAPPSLDGMLLVPDRPPAAMAEPPRPGTAPAAPPAALAAAQLEHPDLGAAIALQGRARAAALGWPAPAPSVLDAATLAAQLAAGRALLEDSSPASLLPLARTVERGGELGTVLGDAAAAKASFRQRLRAALRPGCDPGLCTLAARLGDAELDRRLLALSRRNESLADAIAAACAHPARGVARVAFLLELWAGVTRGGDDDGGPVRDEVARAESWFAPLPDAATAELRHVLARTRSAEVRQRVLLALGVRADAAALPDLLALVEGPNVATATLAAYALGCYDERCSGQLEAAARASRRPELLWTARASHGDGKIRARLAAAGCPADEVALLTSSRLRPEQFPAAAALLRSRTLSLSSRP